MLSTIQSHELAVGKNILTKHRVFTLPLLNESLNRPGVFPQEGIEVELLLLESHTYSIESMSMPIKYGQYFGNRVILNPNMDRAHINPKFMVYGGAWVLYNVEYVCFCEQEIRREECVI